MVNGEPLWHGVRHGGGGGDARQQHHHHHQLSHGFGAKDASASSPWSSSDGLWTDGLVCAFEFVRGGGGAHGFVTPANLCRSKCCSLLQSKDLAVQDRRRSLAAKIGDNGDEPRPPTVAPAESLWAPIGWRRITQLVGMVGGDAAAWHDDGQSMSLMEHDGGGDEQCDDITVADVAAPYWQRTAGPTWWCHVAAGHPAVDAWLAAARWLHPAICVALRDESVLISEKMKHLLYEVSFPLPYFSAVFYSKFSTES